MTWADRVLLAHEEARLQLDSIDRARDHLQPVPPDRELDAREELPPPSSWWMPLEEWAQLEV